MAYDLQSRLDHVGDRMAEVNASDAVYHRGTSAVKLTVSPILADANEIIPGVAITRIERQGFVFDAADLDLAGGPTVPQLGDSLVWNGGTFRLVAEGPDDPPYRYTTSRRNRIRIHTEQIEQSINQP